MERLLVLHWGKLSIPQRKSFNKRFPQTRVRYEDVTQFLSDVYDPQEYVELCNKRQKAYGRVVALLPPIPLCRAALQAGIIILADSPDGLMQVTDIEVRCQSIRFKSPEHNDDTPSS